MNIMVEDHVFPERALVDTGAEVNIIRRGVIPEKLPAVEWPPPYPGGMMVFCPHPGVLIQIPPNFHPGSTDRDDGGGQ